MKLDDREESENVEDRRGMGRKAGIAAGGGGILILILAMIFGVDPQKFANLVGQNPGGGAVQQGDGKQRPADPEEEKLAHFTKVVFHDTETVWEDLFRQMGKQYP